MVSKIAITQPIAPPPPTLAILIHHLHDSVFYYYIKIQFLSIAFYQFHNEIIVMTLHQVHLECFFDQY
jgi:hypothetical protein